jgi:hypothetical protein
MVSVAPVLPLSVWLELPGVRSVQARPTQTGFAVQVSFTASQVTVWVLWSIDPQQATLQSAEEAAVLSSPALPPPQALLPFE